MATETCQPRELAVSGSRDPFRYLADPICVGSLVVYCLGRWMLKPHHIGGWLVDDYLNDFLCLPLLVPIILRLQSLLGIRRHDLPPTLFEILHNWVVFSILYEVILPRLSIFQTTADAWDVVAYLIGGLIAYSYWHQSAAKTSKGASLKNDECYPMA